LRHPTGYYVYAWKDTEKSQFRIFYHKQRVTKSWKELVMPAMQMSSAGKIVGNTSDIPVGTY